MCECGSGFSAAKAEHDDDKDDEEEEEDEVYLKWENDIRP